MTEFRRVGIIAKRQQPNIGLLKDLCQFLKELGRDVLLESHPELGQDWDVRQVERSELAQGCDLIVVVGGDGTMLDAGRALAEHKIPLLGVNQGRLGFMVDVAPETMRDKLAAVLEGEHKIEDRLILQSRILRNGKAPGQYRLAVNDVVVRNQATIRMLEFETWLEQEFISSHRADGIIVTSPTGSSAYALSGGGPLLHPTLSAIALVPICPHTLSDRPIVVSDDRPIRILVHGADRVQAMASFDGQTNERIGAGDIVEVRKAPFSLRMIHPTGHSHFRILRDKLRWGSGPDAPSERV